MLDPDAVALRAKTFSRPMTRRGDLARAFGQAGLGEVVESSVTISMDFADFADFWGPIEGGEGTLGKYASSLSAAQSAALEQNLRAAFTFGQPDGPRDFACSAYVCRGIVAQA
jgi:hypothetical protein